MFLHYWLIVLALFKDPVPATIVVPPIPILREIIIGNPVRLAIPSINIYTNIQDVGLTDTGSMAVPTNSTDTGWFKFGPKPGVIGSAVIAGHLNAPDGTGGVFADLNKLSPGDDIYVQDDRQVMSTFVVEKILALDPGYADAIFSRNDGTYLNLITCDGYWNETLKTYSKRLVVFAKYVSSSPYNESK